MIKAVIFDMDGVLIDTENWLNIYWPQAAKEAGFHFTREHGLALRSHAPKYTGPYLQKIFGPEFDYEAIRARRKQLMKEHIEKNGIEKKPDVDEILDYLRSKNIKTAVATATDPERTKQYLTQIGIYDKFDQLVSATTVENGKPEPDVYLYACEQIGEKPKDCIAVEDSPNGILSAYRAGLSVVMVPDLAVVQNIHQICIQLFDGISVAWMEWHCDHWFDLTEVNLDHSIIVSHIPRIQLFVCLWPSMDRIEILYLFIGSPDRGKAGRLGRHNVHADTEINA